MNVSLHFGGVPVRLARRSRRACPWISGGHKEAPTKRGLKCHLPEGNPSLARRVALTMRAFAARVTRFFGRSTNRPGRQSRLVRSSRGGWMARLFARVKSFPASPAVGRVLSLWQQTPGSIQNDSGLPQKCCTQACTNTCAVKRPHPALLATKGFFRKCQKQEARDDACGVE